MIDNRFEFVQAALDRGGRMVDPEGLAPAWD